MEAATLWEIGAGIFGAGTIYGVLKGKINALETKIEKMETQFVSTREFDGLVDRLKSIESDIKHILQCVNK